MTRFGLVPSKASKLLVKLRERERAMCPVISSFASDKQRQMQSINRFTEEIYDMAAKAKKAIAQQAKPAGEFSWKGFVDVKLSDTDKANYANWDVQDTDVWDGIAQYCEAGIKIAVSYNQQNASFNCAGTGQPTSGANNGYCVVAHAKTPYEAARVWLFKVATILPPIWNEYDVGDSEDIG